MGYAYAPLKLRELQEALAVELGASDLDEDNVPEAEDLISACAGLVIIDQHSNAVRFVHTTTQEFFDCHLQALFPNGHDYIAESCITYLSFDLLRIGRDAAGDKSRATCKNDYALLMSGFRNTMLKCAFLHYAGQWWKDHYLAARSATATDLAYGLLQDDLKSALAWSAYDYLDNYSENSTDYSPTELTGISLAAGYGLSGLTQKLIDDGVSPNVLDGGGDTPLSDAAAMGHLDTVRVPLDCNDIVPDLVGKKYSQTPLIRASAYGHEEVVRLLLKRDDVDVNTAMSDTSPMHCAAYRGHEDVVRTLLSRTDVQPDRVDQSGLTPLAVACCGGRAAIAQVLLDRADVNAASRDKKGRTPLHHAAEQGDVTLVRRLLERGVKPDVKDDFDWLPLHIALKWGYQDVVRLLLSGGELSVDIKQLDRFTAFGEPVRNMPARKVLRLLQNMSNRWENMKL